MANSTLKQFAQRTVKDVMQGRELVTVSPSVTLARAMFIMNERSIHRLPVVEHDKLVGILSISDLRVAVDSPLYHKDEMLQHFQEKHVSDAMRRRVQTVEPSEPVLNVAKLLRVGTISSLVVVEEGTTDKPVGIVTRSDVLDEYIRMLEPIENA